MIQPFVFTATVWRDALVTAVRGLPAAFVFCLPAAIVAVPFTLAGHRFGPEADNPWLVWLGWLVVLTAALIPAFTALLRRASGDAPGLFSGLAVGLDERRTLAVIGLTGVLALTVVGVAFLLFVAFLAALAVASRAAVDAPELAIEAAEHAPEIDAYFGAGEWVAVIVAGTGFALFSVWFVTRLALAFPETLRLGRVQAMAALALSRGRMVSVTLCGSVFALLAGGLVWALRLVQHGDGLDGMLILFAAGWAGLGAVMALLTGFLVSLDAAFVRGQSPSEDAAQA